MWRKLVLVVAVLSVFPLGHGVLAQAGELRVWSALGEEDAAVIESGESCRAVLGVILAAVPGSLLGR